MEFKSKSAIEAAIKQSITSNSNSAIRAMLRIFEYQTTDEQHSGEAREYNCVGFAGVDAKILTSFCQQYAKYGRLSDKQMQILFKKIGKYAGQLTRHAIANGMYVKENKMWVSVKR